MAISLALLPLLVQFAILAAVGCASSEITRRTLVLHRQGFFKMIPNLAIVAASAFVAFALAGPVLAAVAAICSLNVLMMVAGVRRHVVWQRRSLASSDARYKALFARKN
ncbi:hypothetical protein OKW41_006294 [Paraburkholderia sp. UCT70]|uniref:hypothetical protein n=1 Tax=Paraburkholderia sp. UCT70 TaxID=2991068 RepID=UPI003D1D8E6D